MIVISIYLINDKVDNHNVTREGGGGTILPEGVPNLMAQQN